MRKIILIMLLLLVTLCNSLWADGKMYWGLEKVNPDISYQRAYIIFTDKTETMVLQSKYSMPDIDKDFKFKTMPDIGWVVPLPAEPELASMPADLAGMFFRGYSYETLPTYTDVPKIVIFWFHIILFICLVLYVFMASFPQYIPFKLLFHDNPKKQSVLIYSCLAYFLLISMLPPSFATAGGSAGGGVDVVSSKAVGVYDVKVVKSDSSAALVEWLNSNKFNYSSDDVSIFDSYIAKGWCFVVARLRPGVQDKDFYEVINLDGLAAPLILRFASANPIYPMALTGSGGFDTEVLIYLATDKKMTCNGKLTLRYAGPVEWDTRSEFLTGKEFDVTPARFFNYKNVKMPYLIKFRDVLTPEKMKEDIIFYPDPDQSDYREHVIKWWF